MSAAFTPTQRAELRDAFARSRIEAAKETRRLAALTSQAHAATSKVTKKAKQRKTAPLVIEPVCELIPTPPGSRMEVTLTRKDLTAEEQTVFDRLLAVCNVEFSTVDVATHAALVAQSVVSARRRA